MWHIDCNHKVIRWRFVVHGGIDRYSKMITYLKCANNNRASTVAESFDIAISNMEFKLEFDLTMVVKMWMCGNLWSVTTMMNLV